MKNFGSNTVAVLVVTLLTALAVFTAVQLGGRLLGTSTASAQTVTAQAAQSHSGGGHGNGSGSGQGGGQSGSSSGAASGSSGSGSAPGGESLTCPATGCTASSCHATPQ
jgi:hypothetical protein